ncbi:MAG: hypothetical protein IT237_13490 [Bacteroidia bacterium]|nr:hypothetical protein [Bacteroidia bacterium]
MFSTNAQDYAKEGNIEMGGSLAFTSTTAVTNGKEEGKPISQMVIYLPLNYFIADGFAIGFITSFELYVQNESSLTGFTLGGSAGYNFIGESNLTPYVEGRIFYNSVFQSAGNADVTATGFGWALLAGIKVQVTENVLINTGLGYAQRRFKDSEYEGVSAGSNIISLSSGFLFYF